MLLYAYGWVNLITSAGCILLYLYAFARHDVPLADLLQSSAYWLDGADTLVLSNGLTLTSSEQLSIAFEAQAAYYLGLVMAQVWHIWAVKVRTGRCRLSIDDV